MNALLTAPITICTDTDLDSARQVINAIGIPDENLIVVTTNASLALALINVEMVIEAATPDEAARITRHATETGATVLQVLG
ncbi:hypothetical protein ABT282_30895 [Streptomyces sp. NPDC000927]|uniref:hypothetical protein n=1 Tax=Streptomyces sp. NPDC000927 TaxID=3154371 RepID=UPI003334101B